MQDSGDVLRVVLGDQLTRESAALRDIDPARDVVLMAEVAEEATYVRHHKKKIALVLSAMRHFAGALAAEGLTVDYIRLDHPENTGSLGREVARAVARHRPTRVVVTEPGEWRLRQAVETWKEACGVPVEVREDDRFLCSTGDFARWARGRKQLRMEHFYRTMRRRHGILLTENGEPEGGRWNLDRENRAALPDGIVVPSPPRFEPDATTRDVLGMVGARFADHFGDLEPFGFAVTREDAEAAFARFVEEALPRFGTYQDAMRTGEAWLFHSVASVYLNLGLLTPGTVCRRVERAYRDGRAPLNAAEGFIRQVLGWREFVRGIYWLKMPGYAETNALGAGRPLPAFYWTGETDMACLAEVVAQTRREAYAHHIQRLMVAGNFALLAGIDPGEVSEWFLVVYADAYEWVELPNVHGMALYADGGVMASKPYAASGKYIDRMSDYCRHCRSTPTKALGDEACPFNALYWNFLEHNRAHLRNNRRLALAYGTLERMPAERREALQARAYAILDRLAPAEPAAW